MLCAINGTMLPTCTTEGEHEVGEATVDVTLHVSIGEFVDTIEEGEYLAVVLEEAYHGLIKSGELLVRFIASGVVRRTTVEHVSAAIARLVGWYALAEREAEHADTQRTLAVVLGERSRSVLRMRLVDILVGGLVSIGTRYCRLFDVSIAWHLGESAQHVHHVRIGEHLLT